MKPFLPPRRAVLRAGAMLAALLALQPPVAVAVAQAQAWSLEHWVGTWGAAAGPALPANTPALADQTLRLIVRTSIGGNRVRIRLSNETGATALRIGEAHIALRASGGAGIAPGTDRALTFSGNTAVTIAPSAAMLSDPVELNAPPLSDLAVSLYLPGKVAGAALHGSAGPVSYISIPGNFTGAASLPAQRAILSLPFLAAVDVDSDSGAVVMLGDSMTDDGNGRRSDWLARRLQGARDPIVSRFGVVNLGAKGNRLLPHPAQGAPAGQVALERFERDVLATAGVRYVVLMMGIDELCDSPNANPVSAEQLVAAYRQLIARAHEKGIALFGATLAPFEGARCYSARKEAVRQALNDWIRNNGEFDGVIEIDHVLRDPARLARLLPAYDSGDHLHPNEAGFQAMAEGVPLELFSTKTARP